MKTVVLTAVLIAAIGTMTGTSAQTYKRMKHPPINEESEDWHRPHRNGHHHRPVQVETSYNEASTILTVRFQSNSNGGTVEVYRDGLKVADITANGGTTFSCVLSEYGAGNYNVIVSSGNTVIDSRNYTVK